MPRRPRTIEDAAAAAAAAAVEQASDIFVERALGFAERLFTGANQRARAALPASYVSGPFVCAGCKQQFTIDQMEMVHPTNGYGACKRCFDFIWESTEMRVEAIKKSMQAKAKAAAEEAARRAAAGQRPGGSGTQPTGNSPPRRRPWEVLGIGRDATVEEIKKAYRHAVLECHPDMVPPGAPFEEKERARARFEELTRAKDAMLKVREAVS